MSPQVVKHIFPIVPAASSTYVIPPVVAVLLFGLLVLCGYLVYSTRHVRFEISPDGLRISGDLYGRMIPSQKLVIGEAGILDLSRDSESRLAARTNGTGLPGYKSGWFLLANGQKALVFVTERKSVVRIPTRDGYVLLLSVQNPSEFLRVLRLVLQPS